MEFFDTKNVLFYLIFVVTCATRSEGKFAGDPCNTATDPCDTAKGLTCNANNVCECNTDNHFSLGFDQCRLNVGADCFGFFYTCGENAYCDTNPTPNVCTCNDNAELDTATNLCRRKTEMQCLTDADCSIMGKFMVCNSRVCGCGQNQVFNAATLQCEVTYGGACQALNDTIAPCDESNECTMSKCTCKSPTKPNVAGECTLSYNETCDPSNDKCDTTAFLSCDPSNKCACVSSDAVYSDEANACQISAGSACDADFGPRCTPGATCNSGYCTCQTGVPTFKGKCGCPTDYQIWNFYGNDSSLCSKKAEESCAGPSDCDPNALCPSTNVCTCKSNYFEVNPNNGFCFLPYDGYCVDDFNCSPGLKCILGLGLCECPTGETYDRQSQSCKTPLDGRCAVDDACIFGATCQTIGISKRCACANDFQQSGTICIGTLNTACVDSMDCNAAAGLTCDTKSNTCQCQADKYTFETSTNRCVVRAGQKCNESIVDVCESGFSCLAWNIFAANGAIVSDTICLCNVNGTSPLCSGSSQPITVTLLMAIMAAVSTYLAV